MSKRMIRNLIIFASAGALALVLGACGSRVPGVSQEPAAPQVTHVVEAGVLVPTPAPTPTPTPTPAPTTPAPTPVPAPAAPEETVSPTAEFTPPEPEDCGGPKVEAQERVDDSFFADSAFFGNSLVDGLDLLGGLEYGDFYAAASASVLSVSMTRNAALSDGTAATMLQALCEKDYAKIYILLGVNEIAFEPDYFAELYSAMLDRICAEQPEADIYIMSLTPVTRERDEADALFNMERVEEYNAALYRLAEERELHYLDLVEALADENGYLSEELSTDGIHMTQEKYEEWADYLRTHY